MELLEPRRYWPRMVSELHIDSRGDKWYICFPDGDIWFGPYNRAQDAKGQLTRMQKEADAKY